MQPNLDVNIAYEAWNKASTTERDALLPDLIRVLEKYAKAICWRRLPDHPNELGALANGIVWRAIKNFPSYKGEAKFSTWFYALAQNECNRWLRKHKSREETELDADIPSSPAAVDARLDLQRMLSSLEGDDHRLFKMMMDGEDSMEAIGQVLGISAHAAEMRWSRLKEKLRA